MGRRRRSAGHVWYNYWGEKQVNVTIRTHHLSDETLVCRRCLPPTSASSLLPPLTHLWAAPLCGNTLVWANNLAQTGWPLQSLWTWCNPSTYQWIVKLILSTLRISIIWVLFKFLSPLTNFPQSSSSGSFTRGMRNDTTVWISGLALLQQTGAGINCDGMPLLAPYSAFFPSSCILSR
jgi:hypothetical protein